MPAVHFSVDTDVPADRFTAALTDFSDRRPQLWPSLDPARFTVHSVGATTADVSEGSSFAGGIWERGTYDWSRPGLVRLEVTESNAFAPGSSWQWRVSAVDGRTRIEVTVDRRPASWKGRLLAVPLRLAGARIFRTDLDRTLALLASQDTRAQAR